MLRCRGCSRCVLASPHCLACQQTLESVLLQHALCLPLARHSTQGFRYHTANTAEAGSRIHHTLLTSIRLRSHCHRCVQDPKFGLYHLMLGSGDAISFRPPLAWELAGAPGNDGDEGDEAAELEPFFAACRALENDQIGEARAIMMAEAKAESSPLR